MQNKLNQKQVNGRSSTSSAASHHGKQEPRAEFSDLPHGLLAIGTFGTNTGVVQEIQGGNRTDKKDINKDQDQDPSSSDDLEGFNPEEVGKLQKELTKLLTRTKKRKSDVHRELTNNLPLDRFLNCPSSLEVDRRICTADSDGKEEEDIERTINVIIGRCKEISAVNNRKKKKKKKKMDIGKASVSYLLKKIFVCTDGFPLPSPAPGLRDTLQESRMEKFLRMVLHKKMSSSQATARATSAKNYLQDKQQVSKNIGENEKSNVDGHKWVKTDSDFIVLEI
ncbi:PREDICTED: uncharacterized protein LOC104808059 isoform X2 [Tarenaya hassleriana]|uniref:uncharacterized protein LOC104808059 isoform X2 n=1 Tax=Tarenaya hassleriana TaxID=28532 RepID=UPI00053C7375|nr:PREDICTED: uncharacterized protein LOC104808059 isoform X2 [Tarenaya hassleriana]